MSHERLALIGPATWEPLAPLIRKALEGYGLTCELDLYGFGREAQLWSGTAAEFAQFPPRGAFVLPDSRLLFREVLADPRVPFAAAERGREAAEFLVHAIDGLAARHPQVSWTVGTLEELSPGPLDAVSDPMLDPFTVALEEGNRTLGNLVRVRPGWSLLDRRRLLTRWGSVLLRDARLDLLARYPGSSQGMTRLAERIAAHWAAVCGKMKKVLVLDCDNTLWGGIVGEEGVDALRMGEDGPGRAYNEFQRAVLALEARGTILALCSRNNPAEVEEVFARRRDMALPRGRIAAVQIGWQPKSVGLVRLAEELGLALGDFVFVDDNPAEREEVRRSLPQVTVPEFPADAAELPAFGYDLAWRYFYRVSIREEDLKKTEQYRQRSAFQSAHRAAGDPAAFLASLEMKAVIAVDAPTLVARSAQLTQKTNQFNLTLRRYTEVEMARLMAAPDSAVFTASLHDRFGDHGWVGVAVFLRRDEGWALETLLVSCRVLGRSFEEAFARACIEEIQTRAPGPIQAEYVPGPRNTPAADFLDRLGFEPLPEASDASRVYCLPAGTEVALRAPFVGIHWEKGLVHA